MIILSKKAVLIIVFCASLAFISPLLYYRKSIKNYEKNLKEKIVGDLRKEIREIVIAELAANKDLSEDNEIYAQGLNQKVREVLNQELESYQAGALNTETALPAGTKKKAKTANNKTSQSQPESGKINDSDTGDHLHDKPSTVVGKQNAIERTLVEKGGMLLGKGKLQIEPSFTTAHFSANRIHIEGFTILPLVIGEISTETVKRDIFINTISLKYGLLHNFQGEVRIPYRYEYDRVTSDTGVETVRSRGGLGDIDFGLSRQIGFERGMMPDVLFSLGLKTITGGNPYNKDIGLGTGHWGFRSGLVFVKASDPAVIFGSLGYTYNLKRNISDFGKVEPGNTASYSLGTAIALSYQTAITFQFQHDVTFKMKKDGRPVNGSFLNSASLKTGFNWALSKNLSVDFSVSHGLTTDAPDYTVELRFPITF